MKKKRKSSVEDRLLSKIKDLVRDVTPNDSKNEELREAHDKSDTETENTVDNNKEMLSNCKTKITDDNPTNYKKKNRKHSKKDREVKEIVVPPLNVISK